MRKETIVMLFLLLATSLCYAQQIQYSVNLASGAVESMVIDGDATRMNWIVRHDGSQYRWITSSDGWGLGYFSIGGKEYRWSKTAKTATDKSAVYQCGDITVTVNRKKCDDGLIESYIFTNKGNESVSLTDIGILTPFNDNYPNAKTFTHVFALG